MTQETNQLSVSPNNSIVLPTIPVNVNNGQCQGRKIVTILAVGALAIPAGLVGLITSPIFIAASLCVLPVAVPIALCCYCSAKRSKTSEKVDTVVNHTVQNPVVQNVSTPNISIIEIEDETPSIQVDGTPSIQVIEQHVHQEDQTLALQKKNFVEGALKAMNSSVSTDSLDLNIQLSEDQIKDLQQAAKNMTPGVYDRYTINRGGVHTIIILSSLPNVVFKINPRSAKEKTIDAEIAV